MLWRARLRNASNMPPLNVSQRRVLTLATVPIRSSQASGGRIEKVKMTVGKWGGAVRRIRRGMPDGSGDANVGGCRNF